MLSQLRPDKYANAANVARLRKKLEVNINIGLKASLCILSFE